MGMKCFHPIKFSIATNLDSLTYVTKIDISS
jgi:hypothetical protein